MSSYTVVNLKDVEDQAPNFGLSPHLEARFASRSLELENSGVSYQRLAPNFRVPFGHKHDVQEELYVVLSGTARAKLDGELVELGPLDALRVSRETVRAFEAGDEGAEILAFGAPSTGSPGQDTAPIPNWWDD